MSRLAVLTGDIVGSSELAPGALDSVMDEINGAAVALSGWDPGLVTGFARRGGDGWQIALGEARYAFRAALYVQAVVRRTGKDRATRIAIASAPGTLDAATRADLNAASGPAFTDSGRSLDALSDPALMVHAAGGAPAAALRLADHVSQGWTRAQARAMCETLPPDAGPRARAAEALGISRQAVNQAVWAAGWPALQEALGYLEAGA
ncbi:hypothetical protein [Salipiger mucosus]|uniref:Uncharacterized protein n=1 Tax=Salipiger mucosus DSM 16094 TaxID=1123237 RepID=S9Q7E9_9RHOB|nr:hypothetical protein [Salipiger mucosus]EPX75533.1 hypothetical protein Salmuc_04723 [Salipiger mucosus DSM 16094]